MPKRSKLEQNSEIRSEAVRMWRQGQNLDEISENISLRFPDAPSRSGIHRFIQKIRPFLQLQEAGFFSNEDLDLLTQSQNLASIANGLLIQCLVNWQDSQEIDQDQLKGLLSLVSSAAKMSSAAAGVEKTKTQLSRHYEGLMNKVAAAAARALPDDEARDKLMAELRDERAMANYKQQAFSRAIARAQKQADPEKEARLKRAEKDFGFFCRHYMSEGFTVPFGRYQLEVVDIVSRRGITEGQAQKLSGYIKQDRQDVLVPSENLSGLLDLEPRDHGKSTRMSTAFPLWLVCTRPGVFPVIIGANRTRALDFLSTIKQDIEDGDRILEDFGDLKGPTWKSDKITLANGNAIAALGSGEGIRGIKDRYRKPTHIICDDLLKDDEVESKASRDKLYKWFKRTVMNLGKDAFIVLVNTILHPDDLPSRLIKEIREGKLKNWSGLWFSATTRGGLQGSPIWPERWSIEDLQEKRESLGPVIYATEWDNEPMAESDRKFRREWFVTYDLSDVNPAGMRIIAAVDPATGASMGDYSAIVIVGAVDHVFYVLEAWGGRVSDIGLISKLVDLYGVWRPREVLFEEIGFQRIYKDLVVREAAKLGVPLPMEGIKQSVSKQLRISALSPLVESGVIRFRKNQSLLMDQLENFPRDHDDLPDALEMCTSRLMGVGTGQARGFTYAVRRKTEDIINKARRFYG